MWAIDTANILEKVINPTVEGRHEEKLTDIRANEQPLDLVYYNFIS
jgi:hypothetical protein